MGVDGALVGLDLDAMYRVQQLPSRENAAGLPREGREQRQLRACELDRVVGRVFDREFREYVPAKIADFSGDDDE